MKTGLKLGLLGLMVFGVAETVMAQGYYQGLNYRQDDPFLFCRKGQDRKIDALPCWIPLPPYTGNFTVMPYCVPPSKWGKKWTNDDRQSLSEYVTRCPHAEDSGRWEGPGIPEHTGQGTGWH